MPLPSLGPPRMMAGCVGDNPLPGTGVRDCGDTVPRDSPRPGSDTPVDDDTGRDIRPEPHDEAEADADAQSHDDTRRRRLRLRLSVATQETIRSVAAARGVSEAGLLDALLHGLEAADQDWLDGVIERARRLDAYYRSEQSRTITNDASQAQKAPGNRSSGA